MSDCAAWRLVCPRTHLEPGLRRGQEIGTRAAGPQYRDPDPADLLSVAILLGPGAGRGRAPARSSRLEREEDRRVDRRHAVAGLPDSRYRDHPAGPAEAAITHDRLRHQPRLLRLPVRPLYRRQHAAHGGIRKALLLVGDKCASLDDPLFSDCGTATALEFDPDAPPIHFDMNSDGRGYRAIILPVGGHREPIADPPSAPAQGRRRRHATRRRPHPRRHGRAQLLDARFRRDSVSCANTRRRRSNRSTTSCSTRPTG